MLVAFTLAGRLIGVPLPASAQQSAYAAERPETPESLARYAVACLKRGEDAFTERSQLAAYREGLEFAQRAVAADERNATAHFAVFANNGRLMQMDGVMANPFSVARASRELDRALELDPNYSDALAAKGGVYRQLPRLLGGNLDKAETYLNRAIELDPNAVGARIELAETYRDMGFPERGVPLLQTAAEIAERLGKFRQLVEARTLLRQLRTDR